MCWVSQLLVCLHQIIRPTPFLLFPYACLPFLYSLSPQIGQHLSHSGCGNCLLLPTLLAQVSLSLFVQDPCWYPVCIIPLTSVKDTADTPFPQKRLKMSVSGYQRSSPLFGAKSPGHPRTHYQRIICFSQVTTESQHQIKWEELCFLF